MIKKLPLLLLLLSIFTYAQQPYYDDVDIFLTGLALRDALAVKIQDTHTNNLEYSPGIWEACRITDLDPEDPTNDNVLLMYGYDLNVADMSYINDLTANKNDHQGNIGQVDGSWNREHVFVNSLAVPDLDTFGDDGPPYADAHNLRACNGQKNGQRANRLFTDGSGNSGTVGAYFYPGDEWRGDVARIAMYMYLRYGSQCYPSYLANGDTNAVDANMINLLLEWNREDPVSPYEDARNTYHDSGALYAQGNRNPFIDNPYLATVIWGGLPAEDRWGIYAADTEDPSVPANLMVTNTTSTTISLSWDASTDNIGIQNYDVYMDGLLNTTVGGISTTINGLTPESMYSFEILARDFSGNTSALSNSVDATTLEAGSGATDLFISEYIEGSSNNKALEIANFTGLDVDLSDYSLRRNTNGGGNWDADYPLSGTLINGEVFVLAHSSADFAAETFVDEIHGSSPINFNGNDPVGLFKEGILIDIIGVFNGGAGNFAQNITLVRNAEVTSPNTIYDTNEWTSFAQNYTDNLGMHNIALSIVQNTLNEFTLYPNPVDSNEEITLQLPPNTLIKNITIFNTLGQEVFRTKENQIINNKIQLTNLSKGIHFIKINTNKGRAVKKLIIK